MSHCAIYKPEIQAVQEIKYRPGDRANKDGGYRRDLRRFGELVSQRCARGLFWTLTILSKEALLLSLAQAVDVLMSVNKGLRFSSTG